MARARGPARVPGHRLQVNGQPQADGKTVQLWAQDHAGWLTMDAVATLR